MMKRSSIVLAVSVSIAAAFFTPYPTQRRQDVKVQLQWLDQALEQASQFFLNDDLSVAAQDEQDERLNTQVDDAQDSKKSKRGRVIRIARRAYRKDGSTPSSPHYTTRKESSMQANIAPEGLEGDYNHYRTAALASTKDRAVSMLTTDAMKYVRALHPSAQDGDLGENILIDGLGYRDFRVGLRFQLGGVELEVTERIEPCANLCKLKPKQRIARCQDFVTKLDVQDGLRGWYAKVIETGSASIGQVVSFV